ncbi:uncharacterized protein LOC144438913 [Glandiceps talaboti]
MWRLMIFAVYVMIVTGNRESVIPASLLYRMRDVRSAKDFVRLFHRPPPPPIPPVSPAGAADEGEWGNGQEGNVYPPGVRPLVPGEEEVENDYAFNIIAELPVCAPKPTAVAIPSDPDPYVYIWPPCVELHRCGGCCNNELFSCEATTTANVDVKVYRSQFDPEYPDVIKIERVATFTMTNETSCACSCKVKLHHCNLGIHRHENCQCVCIQTDRDCPVRKVWDDGICDCVCRAPPEDRFCYSKKKSWNNNTCRCECRRHDTCEVGYIWNSVKCRCERERRVNHSSDSNCPTSCPNDLYLVGCQCRRLFASHNRKQRLPNFQDEMRQA